MVKHAFGNYKFQKITDTVQFFFLKKIFLFTSLRNDHRKQLIDMVELCCGYKRSTPSRKQWTIRSLLSPTIKRKPFDMFTRSRYAAFNCKLITDLF